MGVGLVRSLPPPNILWIHCNNLLKVYNSIANTSEGALFLSPSDVYVRSFLYLFCALRKLHHTKALSHQALSLAPDWILLLWRPGSPASFMLQQRPFTCASVTLVKPKSVVQGQTLLHILHLAIILPGPKDYYNRMGKTRDLFLQEN